MTKDKNFKIAVTGLVILLIYYVLSGIIHSVNKKEALKNGTVVNAVVTYGLISNGNTILFLRYRYAGKSFEVDYSVPADDTLKKGDQVKLLVAKEAPDIYYQIIK